MKPNIYECKICQEHHCEHDFPEESVQELSPMFNAHPIVLQPPPVKHTQSPKPARIEEKVSNGKKDEKPSSSKTAEKNDKK